MSNPITEQELINAGEDARDLADVVNGAADLNGDGTVETRTGGDRRTLAKLEADFQSVIDDQTVQQNAAGADADRAEAAATAAQRAATPQVWGSIRLPYENGESIARGALNGGITIPDVNNLFKDAGNATKPFLSTEGAWAVLWDMPLEEYGSLRRRPVLMGSENINRANGNRRMILAFEPVSNVNQSDPAKYGRFRAYLQQEAAGGAVDVYSAAIAESEFSGAGWIVLRNIGTGFVLDVFDLVTGTKIEGVEQAKPNGWLGVHNLTQSLSIGIDRSSFFPVDVQTAPNGYNNQNFGYARGQFGGALFIDGETSDADWQNVATGSDPELVFAGKWRMYLPGVSNGEKDLTIRQSGTAHAGGEATQLGTLLPGRSMGRGIVANREKGTCFVPVIAATDFASGRLKVSGRSDSPVDSVLETRLITKHGTRIVQDWTRVANLGPVFNFTAIIPGNKEPMVLQARERLANNDVGPVYVLIDEVNCGWAVNVDGQSQVTFALSQNTQNDILGGGFDIPNNWGPDGGINCFFARASANAAGIGRGNTGILRLTSRPELGGSGTIEFIKVMRTYTDWPILITFTAISGTTIRDKLSDEDGSGGVEGGVNDVRDMQDVYNIVRNISGVDEVDKIALSAYLQVAHSGDNVNPYWERVSLPNLTGVPDGSYITDVDDWPLSGNEMTANMPVVLFPMNRGISTSAGPEVFSDPYDPNINKHGQRVSLREGASEYGVFIGPETDVQHLDGYVSGDPTRPGVFTHPSPDTIDGASLMAKHLAEGAAGVLGLGRYRGVSANPISYKVLDEDTIRVTFDGPIGMRLSTYRGGAEVSGFEVNRDRRYFTAEIETPRSVLITRASGALYQAGITFVSFKIGGPGDYGQFNVDWWLDHALCFAPSVNDLPPLFCSGSDGEVITT